MANSSRQSSIFGTQEWQRLYQTYRTADLQSYDYETIRSNFIEYLQTNYPETFNDYTQSSEYIALLDMISFMGQGLAFRDDLNARENFIDTAERRDSVVKLANLVSYTPKRNTEANGTLKITSIATSENVYDINGYNLANNPIQWNDPTNPNWQEQFTAIINATLVNSQRFGRPGNSQDILGIQTSEYSVNTPPATLPIVPFSSTVDGVGMNFELVSVSSVDSTSLYELPPIANGKFNLLYQNDKLGYGSAKTGWFVYFKQGTLKYSDFSFSQVISNQVQDINIEGVNNTDTWLFKVNSTGTPTEVWKQVANIYANSDLQTATSTKKIFSVTSRANDQVSYVFGDGVFSEIPSGSFRAFVRSSNGLQYVIDPTEMQGLSVTLSYVSRTNKVETLTLNLTLTQPVSNAQNRESIAQIKQRAPARYYTQNRMVNGEDYSNFPYTLYNSIIKSTAINRSSIGVSRSLDLLDPTGKYSSTNSFGTDGALYQVNSPGYYSLTITDRNDITTFISEDLTAILKSTQVIQYYDQYFPRYAGTYPVSALSDGNLYWNQATTSVNSTTGFFYLTNNFSAIQRRVAAPDQTAGFPVISVNGRTVTMPVIMTSELDENPVMGSSATIFGFSPSSPWNTTVTVTASSVAQTTAGENYLLLTVEFPTSVPESSLNPSLISVFGSVSYQIYIKNNNQTPIPVGTYSTYSPMYITSGAMLEFVPPQGYHFDKNNRLVAGAPSLDTDKMSIWVTVQNVVGDGMNGGDGNLTNGSGPISVNEFIPSGAIVNNSQPGIIPVFGNQLPDDVVQKMIISMSLGQSFSLVFDNSLSIIDQRWNYAAFNADDWMVNFEATTPTTYTVTFRNLKYFFGSVEQTRFLFASNQTVFDPRSGTTIQDSITVLKTNSQANSNSPYPANIKLNVIGQDIQADGYVDDYAVEITSTDSRKSTEIYTPDFFSYITGYAPSGSNLGVYVFFEGVTDSSLLNRQQIVPEGAVVWAYPNITLISLAIYQYPLGTVFYATGTGVFYKSVQPDPLVNFYELEQVSNYSVLVGRQSLQYQYQHNSGNTTRIDPATTNIIDIYLVTQSYFTAYQNWIQDTTGTVPKPIPPSQVELEQTYPQVNQYKMMSDTVALNAVVFKPLFGDKAPQALQSTIKVIKSTSTTASDSEIKSAVLSAMNAYFNINNWDFGETFYFSELSAYLHQQLSTLISSVVLVPNDPSLKFGDLYEVGCAPYEIFVNGATANDIEVIAALTPSSLRI